MDLQLAQRGRALIDFEVSARRTANRLQGEVEGELARQGLDAAALPDDMDERHAVIERALAGSKLYGARALFGEWCASQHGLACYEAFEQVRDEVEPQLEALEDGPATVTQAPDYEPPAYYSKVWFHRTHGGWDGDPLAGFVQGELVHKRYVAKVFPGDIYAERRRVAELAPRRDYKRILEVGTSSGHYTSVLSEMFPDAEIVGLDPAKPMLEQARRVANALGLAWDLHVGVGEAAPFPDGSFDLVTGYAVHHELPVRIVDAMFTEALRLLRPGGDVLFSDAARTADWDKMKAWAFDWVARWHGEPYWRASCALDFRQGAEAAGFVDVRDHRLAPQKTYAVTGRKPAEP